MRSIRLFLWLVCALLIAGCATRDAKPHAMLPGAQRVLILGDSITYSGQYVEIIDAYFVTRFPARRIQILNLGLPSETVSGLSEEGHADGKFPRPDLHERLDRALPKTKPDLVFACYGMNDGIYLPLDEERFAKFREGMEWLHGKASAAGAQIVHLTPPTFHKLDARPTPGSDGKQPASLLAGYNLVLDRYAQWLLEQRSKGW